MGAIKVNIGEVGNGGKFDMQAVFDAVYPVGCIYQSFVNTNPSQLFGGQWQQITGRFLRAANDTSVGGSDTVTLNISQIPSHSHTVRVVTDNTGGAAGISLGGNGYQLDMAKATSSTGGGQAHNNMPAYQDVYTWRRIA